MKLGPIPVNEFERLRALYALDILDTQPDEEFDRITRIIHQVLDVQITAITFVDKNRIWFKSKQGFSLEANEIDRCDSFCGVAICQKVTADAGSRIFEVSDTHQDCRFVDNPLVTGEPWIRFNIGFILQSTTGMNLGTLCLADNRPRKASEDEKKLLTDFGLMVQKRLNEIAMTANFNLDDVAIVSNIAHRVFDEIGTFLKNRGISISEWRVLDKLVQLDFATPTKISQQIGISPPQVSKILESLETKRLIKRIYNIEDRRVVKLECNEQGRKLWHYGNRIGNRIIGQLHEQ